MNKFRIGDTVRCIECDSSSYNKIGVIEQISLDGHVYVVFNGKQYNYPGPYDPNAFKLIKPFKPEPLPLPG